jgi:folylpolyglutamate synthase/dihydropteroate synthase
VPVVLDVGHNPPALTQLMAKLRLCFGDQPMRVVLGMSKDKDMAQCVRILFGSGANIRHVHLVKAMHPRAAPPANILEGALVRGGACLL